MLYTGYKLDHPAIVRYPRGEDPAFRLNKEMHELPLGKARLVRTGNAPKGAELQCWLSEVCWLRPKAVAEKIDATVYDMRFVNAG